jgi:hypothetical protein
MAYLVCSKASTAKHFYIPRVEINKETARECSPAAVLSPFSELLLKIGNFCHDPKPRFQEAVTALFSKLKHFNLFYIDTALL